MMARMVLSLDEQKAPADQPWLISSCGELARDMQDMDRMVQETKQEHPFPVPTTYLHTLQWAESVERRNRDNFVCFMRKWAESVEGRNRDNFVWFMRKDVLPAICFEHAPHSLELLLLINRTDIEGILQNVDSSRLLQSPYVRPCPTAASTSIKSFIAWLTTADVGTAISQDYLGHQAADRESELCLLASMPCAKTDPFDKAMQRLCRSLGLEGSTIRIPDCGVKQLLTRIGKRVGEHPFFTLSAADGTAAVPFHLCRGPPQPKESTQPESFVSALREQQKATNGSRAFMVVKRDDAEDDEQEADDGDDACEERRKQPSAATHNVLWLPGLFDEDRSRVGEHIREGKGETTSIQARLETGDMDSGNLTFYMLKAEYHAMKNSYGCPLSGGPHTQFTPRQRKLSRSLAITLAFVEGGESWMRENEVAVELADLIEGLATYWRTQLLIQSNATLGLGRTSSDADGAASRNALCMLLKQLGRRIERCSGVAFNAVPGPKRVRKRLIETDEDFEARRMQGRMQQTSESPPKAPSKPPSTDCSLGMKIALGMKKHKRPGSAEAQAFDMEADELGDVVLSYFV